MSFEFPNYYSSTPSIVVSTTCALGVTFGFNVTYLRLSNQEAAADFYLNFTSTSPNGANRVTTTDFFVRACSEVILPNLPAIRGFALYTTSTAATVKTLHVTGFADMRSL